MERLLRLLAVAALLPLFTLAAGCCAVNHAPPGDPEAPYPLPAAPQVGQVVHLRTGVMVSEARLLEAAGDARIVYVGETHDNPAAHRLQLAVLKALAERWPGEVSLGMEMFTPAQQPVLDRWVAGELDEKAFLRESGWHATWSMDFAFYRELLLFARERGIPVVGLNADKGLVSALGRRDAAALDEAERTRLPEMDMSDPYQTALVEAYFGGHAGGNGMLAGFQRVQTLWDESMAENIVRHLTAFPERRQRMVVLAGGNHIRYGFGIPRRVFRRLPLSYLLVGSEEVAVAPGAHPESMDVQLPRFPMPPFDYLAYTLYEAPPAERVKLGLGLEERDGRVTVNMVMPGSPAANAGVRKGDVVTACDGTPVAEPFDLIYAVGQKSKGDKAALEVERDGTRLTLEADLQPWAGHGGMGK